ncbi:aldehyde dehydrogenase family protein [Auritidibacter sp. NML100628]|uniref:aldehyde dehydrogenase family protein n=1 Tax=Auritidibacter sp. NML100628 TaxID=2170742 RepID=UPI000D73BC57|nr:aldehyde dehydrogenase family protein [Auritidibacter sp. NML100628]PXA77080.1 aldehyde dehydrogenase [Auritidibacter sp. NML100628]
MTQETVSPVLPVLTHRGKRDTQAQQPIFGVDGTVLATTSQAPALLIAQAIAAQARAEQRPAGTNQSRFNAAADAFSNSTLGGITFEEHCRLVSAVSGHGPEVTRTATTAVARAIAQAPERADQARPRGSATDWTDVLAGAGSGVWARRGSTLGVVLAGNSPTIQNGWLQALALGYQVAVRPSRREPFTAYRTVLALRAAGFSETEAVYLPGNHDTGAEILRRCDLGFVYGGDDIVARYDSTPTVKVHGPGRTKTLVTAASNNAHALAQVADSVSALSGTGCINTSAVYVEGDHQAFAADLANELTARARRRALHDDHLGPRVPETTATIIAQHLERMAQRATPVIPLCEAISPHPEGGAVLGPAVFTVESADDQTLATELPFPCVVVAPWTRQDGHRPLRNSLIVNAIADDEELISALIADSTVRNVYTNTATIASTGLMPHEDYVGTFLMRNKAFADSYRA